MANCLFVLCIFSLLNLASLINYPSPPSGSGLPPKPVSYYHASANGELGVRFTFNPPTNKAMHVIISYDTLSEPVKTFFTSQLNNAVLDQLTQCSTFALFFLPCSMSKLQNGALTCALGPNQCNYDRIHSCVADQLKDDRVTLAKFIICAFSGKPYAQCNPDNCIDQQAVSSCVQNKNGDKLCDAFHTEIENEKRNDPSNQPSTGEKKPDATTDFKKVVCSYLAQANLVCDPCYAT